MQSKPSDGKNSTQEHISPNGIVTESRALLSDASPILLKSRDLQFRAYFDCGMKSKIKF